MVVFDHEEAFARCHRSYNQAYPAAKPWQVGGVWGHYDGGGQHIFAPYLKRKATTQLDWRDTMHHFLLVPPRDLFQYAAEIPAEWAPATGRSIAEYLCEGMERLHTMATFISGGLVKK